MRPLLAALVFLSGCGAPLLCVTPCGVSVYGDSVQKDGYCADLADAERAASLVLPQAGLGNVCQRLHGVTVYVEVGPDFEVWARPNGEPADVQVRTDGATWPAQRFMRLGNKPALDQPFPHEIVHAILPPGSDNASHVGWEEHGYYAAINASYVYAHSLAGH